jgi:hypothetical protein
MTPKKHQGRSRLSPEYRLLKKVVRAVLPKSCRLEDHSHTILSVTYLRVWTKEDGVPETLLVSFEPGGRLSLHPYGRGPLTVDLNDPDSLEMLEKRLKTWAEGGQDEEK